MLPHVSLLSLAMSAMLIGTSAWFQCPQRYGVFPDDRFCNYFWTCDDGVADLHQCPFNSVFKNDFDDRNLTFMCYDKLRVNCGDKVLFQGAFACPYENGFFAHDDSCYDYWDCTDGRAEHKSCQRRHFIEHPPLYAIADCVKVDTKRCVKNEWRQDSHFQLKGNQMQLERFVCPEQYGYFAHHQFCGRYWPCEDYVSLPARNCPTDFLFDTRTQSCRPNDLVDCGKRLRYISIIAGLVFTFPERKLKLITAAEVSKRRGICKNGGPEEQARCIDNILYKLRREKSEIAKYKPRDHIFAT